MLATQVLPTRAWPKSEKSAGFCFLSIMQSKACSPSLELNHIFFSNFEAIVSAIWLDTALIRLTLHDITCMSPAPVSFLALALGYFRLIHMAIAPWARLVSSHN